MPFGFVRNVSDPVQSAALPSQAQGNWWWWTIGVPNDLAPTLFLVTQANPVSSQVFDAATIAQLEHDVHGQLVDMSGRRASAVDDGVPRVSGGLRHR